MDPTQQPPTPGSNVVPFAPGAPASPFGGPAAAASPTPDLHTLFTTDVLPLPDEGRGSRAWWKKELEAAEERITAQKPDWDRNIQSYRSKSLQKVPITDMVTVPRDFTYVEQKRSTLFFQVPDVHLKPLQDGLKGAIPLFQAVLNQLLSEDGLDALATMQECIFDAICPAGILCSVIGFEVFAAGAVPMQIGTKPDPNFMSAGRRWVAGRRARTRGAFKEAVREWMPFREPGEDG